MDVVMMILKLPLLCNLVSHREKKKKNLKISDVQNAFISFWAVFELPEFHQSSSA